MSEHDTPCADFQDLLHGLRRGRLPAAEAEAARRHLEECSDCRREDAAERALDAALAERLPAYPAPEALRARVERLLEAAQAPAPAPRPRPAILRQRRALVPAALAAMALLSAGVLAGRRMRASGEALDRLGEEVVEDHLRLLASAHPHDVESSATHEVKPWFEGRLDFAPTVPPDGGELRLLGGAVGYVLDRKAAAISYALRRHRVTLLAFPAAGLEWPAPDRRLGAVPARALERSGFHAILWRAGALGYALVSDVDPAELLRLAERFAPATAGPPAPG